MLFITTLNFFTSDEHANIAASCKMWQEVILNAIKT